MFHGVRQSDASQNQISQWNMHVIRHTPFFLPSILLLVPENIEPDVVTWGEGISFILSISNQPKSRLVRHRIHFTHLVAE